MNWIISGLVFLILFAANFLQAITGFAGTLIAMPPTMKLIGVDSAKALLNAIAQISSLMIVCSSYQSIRWKEVFKMLIGMFIGMAIGLWIYAHFPMHQLLVCYGILIIAIALKKLFFPSEWVLSKGMQYVILLGAGIIHGMFVSGGALLVVYASLVFKKKEEFRANLAFIWLITGFYITGIQIQQGHFSSYVLFLLIVGIIPVFLGTYFGSKLVKKLDQALFMKITYVLLILAGIMAIV